MATVKEVAELRKLAYDMGLSNTQALERYTDEQLASGIYNGIGPEAFPEWLREFVNALNPSLVPVALIHDIEWYETDGTEESWIRSNDRFKTNGYKAAAYNYRWWNPLRWWVRRQARLFRLACMTHAGWKAWKNGRKKCPVKDATV